MRFAPNIQLPKILSSQSVPVFRPLNSNFRRAAERGILIPIMRKPLIAANWKMFKTPTEAAAFTSAFLPLVAKHHHVDIVLCPSATSLATTIDAVAGTHVHVAAQNMHWLDFGAYTGETSPIMLKAIDATHILIGHSERRQYFNETDETVNLKLKSALTHHLVPIVCVGEHLAERESGHTVSVL